MARSAPHGAVLDRAEQPLMILLAVEGGWLTASAAAARLRTWSAGSGMVAGYSVAAGERGSRGWRRPCRPAADPGGFEVDRGHGGGSGCCHHRSERFIELLEQAAPTSTKAAG
jgi:hypothetical protein